MNTGHLFVRFSSAQTHKHTRLDRDVQDIMDRSVKEELHSALEDITKCFFEKQQAIKSVI